MKTAVVYKSVTGNTRRVAEAVREAVEDTECVFFGEPAGVVDADLYFVGSWTDKGMCAPEIEAFLKGLQNKKIAYFGTAGFGGSQEYYDALYSRVCAVVPESCRMTGYFFCQGKMPESVRERYVSLLT